MRPAVRPRLPVGTDIWVCESNFIICQHGDHLLRFLESGYRADYRRVTGHAFLQCRECHPPQYFLAVLVKEPYPMATCYALSKASYDEWDKSPEDTPSTPELLYLVRDPQGRSYNPHWRPQSNRRD